MMSIQEPLPAKSWECWALMSILKTSEKHQEEEHLARIEKQVSDLEFSGTKSALKIILRIFKWQSIHILLYME